MRIGALPPLALVLFVALTACSSSGSGSKAAPTTTARAVTTSRPATTTTTGGTTTTDSSGSATTTPAAPKSAIPDAATVVSVADVANLGKLLVGADGRTLYTFNEDSVIATGCTGTCARTWPLLAAKRTPIGGPGVEAGELTNVDGKIAYFGHLLHSYAGDANPGDVKGLKVQGWKAISPTGASVG